MTKTKHEAVETYCVDVPAVYRAPYVHTRPSSTRWQFAMPVPPDVAHHFTSQWACRKSLGTSDLREANTKAKLLAAAMEQKFAQLRQKDSPSSHPGPQADIAALLPVALPAVAPPAVTLPVVTLTPELIAETAALHLARALEADEAMRLSGLTSGEFEMQSMALDIELARLKMAYASGDSSVVEALLPPLLAASGLRVADTDPLRPMLARELVKARLRALQGRQSRQQGELLDTPPEPALPHLRAIQADTEVKESAALAPADKPAHILRLRDVLEAWKGKATPPAPKTVATAERVVTLFEEVCGNPFLHQLTRQHGLKYRDHLLASGLSPATTADRLSWVSTLLRYEMEERQRITVDPWATIKVERSNERVLVRKASRGGQMTALFGQPLFQRYELPKAANAGRDAAYWVPVMAAYTGARITELAQLLVTDLAEVDGLPCIRFAKTHAWQSIKNESSRRTIPMHPELIRLGLLEYAKAIQAAGHERLFPMAPVSGINNAGGALSSWFSKLKTASGWGPEHTFHSFRHTVETVLKRAKEPAYQINAYTGHAHGGGAADDHYTHLEPADLLETAQKVIPDGLELPRVWPPAGWTPPAPMAELLQTKSRKGESESAAEE